MLLKDAVDLYVSVHSRVRSQRTINAYRSTVTMLSTHLGRDAVTSDLVDSVIGPFWRWRATQVSANTVNGEATTLLALWRWLALEGRARAPRIEPPPREKKVPRALDAGQVRDLWLAAADARGAIAEVPANVYWPALLYTSWDTAERIGAVLAVTWQDVDDNAGHVRYPAATRKGGTRELVRAIRPATCSWLKRLRRVSPHPLPFGVVNRSVWYYHWHALRSSAGLPDWVRPHTIRKSAASHVPTLSDAAELLGHSSERLTRDSYRDPRIADGRQALRKLPDPLRRRWLPWGR